jgi:transcriptional regulator with XRE-family HTH domain
MPRKRTLTPGVSPVHFFGAEVRRAREAAGMSQTELGRLAGCDDSVVSRVEGGLEDPPHGFPEACDQAFPGMGGFFTRFYNDSHEWEGPYPRWAEDWMRAENTAVTLRMWQPLIVPGLLQTAEYSRALFLGERSDLSQDALDRLVSARLERQRIFERDHPPHTSVVLDESVLHRLIGSPQVVHDQLLHMADMSMRSFISVQVVAGSVGAHPGLAGAFMIASCDGKPDILYFDAVEGQTMERNTLVRKFAIAFDLIRSEALPASASRETILKAAEERWKT